MDGNDAGARPLWASPVARPEHPVAAAAEADARDAARAIDGYIIRGPLFGLAAQADGESGWRVVAPVVSGDPQEERDNLQSRLWFQARDEAESRGQRRALLDAVARLARERIDEVDVAGVRYRVVRGDEFVYTCGGDIDVPRPTDPEPAEADWGNERRGPKLDDGAVIDPASIVSPMTAAERFALSDLHYTAQGHPEDVRADSARALHTHPAVTVLPPAFGIFEKKLGAWTSIAGLHATVQEARKQLHYLLDHLWPRIPELAQGAEPEQLQNAAALLRAQPRAHHYELLGRRFVVARIGRLVRIGEDGPEGPRASDRSASAPIALHPPMDDDGTIRDEAFDE